MAEGKWRTWPDQLVYRRPYEDAWGVLHDPTTEWDELLKNHKPWVMLLLVGDGTRRMARPASAGAQKIIRKEQQRRLHNMARINDLEAGYLEWNNRKKHWKRRRRNKVKARGKAACYKKAPSGA
jgi:hypothetical protein